MQIDQSSIQIDDELFKIDYKQCIFMKEDELKDLENSYAFITDDTINEFISQIQSQYNIQALMICQDFFYQKIEEWCAFQDQVALLFTHLPDFNNLKNLYIKFDIYSQNEHDQFQKIDLQAIDNQGKLQIGSYFNKRYNKSNQIKYVFNNVLEMLAYLINKQNINIHLIMDISQSINTNHFIDYFDQILNLKSIEIKYYCNSMNVTQDNHESNRNLFFNLTRKISKCQQLQKLKIIIPNENKLTPMSFNEGGEQEQYSQEIMQLIFALSQCACLKSVSLNLPIQFFLQDYLKQKNIQEQKIKQNLKQLINNNSIKIFELHLIKFKNTPNLRRRTQQINNLQQILKKGIMKNLSHLVHIQQ